MLWCHSAVSILLYNYFDSLVVISNILCFIYHLLVLEIMLAVNPGESPTRRSSRRWCGLHPEYSELEVKCLAILSRNVKHKEEIAYHMNSLFKRDAGKSALAVKISKFEKAVPEKYLVKWQEYHGHPKGDSEDLDFLRKKLDFHFITGGGCLWDPGEVDDIWNWHYEGFGLQEIR